MTARTVQQIVANEINPDQFINKHIDSKSSEFQFYLHQIYPGLLSELRATYRNLPYNVLSKKKRICESSRAKSHNVKKILLYP
ncbi:hypothetical protein HZS_5474 [Henneguya salminicola]|nr:hypothetical protein HZS_5474 [Henneguya salminicola]